MKSKQWHEFPKLMTFIIKTSCKPILSTLAMVMS